MQSNARKLASWIQNYYPYSQREQMTHLKLQKLMFYCYGAALAFDVDYNVGVDIEFGPWQHGPVNEEIWREYRQYGSSPIPSHDRSYSAYNGYSFQVEEVLQNALDIYGAMTAWSLRQQSHSEEPWIEAWRYQYSRIDKESMRHHFRAKFCGRRVFAPEYLSDPGTFTIDGIPIVGYRSFAQMAESIRSIYNS
jgi:uncharacterized phage-associated protein